MDELNGRIIPITITIIINSLTYIITSLLHHHYLHNGVLFLVIRGWVQESPGKSVPPLPPPTLVEGPTEETEDAGEIGEEGVATSSIVSSKMSGHFSSCEWRTQVHPAPNKISAPWGILDMKHSA